MAAFFLALQTFPKMLIAIVRIGDKLEALNDLRVEHKYQSIKNDLDKLSNTRPRAGARRRPAGRRGRLRACPPCSWPPFWRLGPRRQRPGGGYPPRLWKTLWASRRTGDLKGGFPPISIPCPKIRHFRNRLFFNDKIGRDRLDPGAERLSRGNG